MASAMDIQQVSPPSSEQENASTSATADPPRVTKRPLSLSRPQDIGTIRANPSPACRRKKVSRGAAWKAAQWTPNRRVSTRQSMLSSPPPLPQRAPDQYMSILQQPGTERMTIVSGHHNGLEHAAALNPGEGDMIGAAGPRADQWGCNAFTSIKEMSPPGVDDFDEALGPRDGTGGGAGSLGGGSGGCSARCRPTDTCAMDIVDNACPATVWRGEPGKGRAMYDPMSGAVARKTAYVAGIRDGTCDMPNASGGWYGARSAKGGSS